MAQDAIVQIVTAIERIDDVATLITGDGVDREISALEVLLQRDIGRGVHGESAITTAALALGSC